MIHTRAAQCWKKHFSHTDTHQRLQTLTYSSALKEQPVSSIFSSNETALFIGMRLLVYSNSRHPGSLNSSYPDPQLHVFPSINFHPFIQQTNLLKILPIDYKATDQSGTPAERGDAHGNNELKWVMKTYFTTLRLYSHLELAIKSHHLTENRLLRGQGEWFKKKKSAVKSINRD